MGALKAEKEELFDIADFNSVQVKVGIENQTSKTSIGSDTRTYGEQEFEADPSQVAIRLMEFKASGLASCGAYGCRSGSTRYGQCVFERCTTAKDGVPSGTSRRNASVRAVASSSGAPMWASLASPRSTALTFTSMPARCTYAAMSAYRRFCAVMYAVR